MLVHFSHLTHCIHVNTHTPVYTLLLGCRTTTSNLKLLTLYTYSCTCIQVEDLARLSLRRPVRVKTSLAPSAIAPRLIQGMYVRIMVPPCAYIYVYKYMYSVVYIVYRCCTRILYIKRTLLILH